MPDLVIKEVVGDILVLTINRPEKRNALSPELVTQLHAEIKKVRQDDRIKVVVLTGAGNVFCAGADLAYLRQIRDFSHEENLKDSQTLSDLFFEIYQLPKITIAMLNGSALAGGCGMALCCDYRFSALDGVKLGFTEVKIGFVPAIVMNFLIRRLPLDKAFHLAMSGKIITAETAAELGLVHKVSSIDDLRDETFRFVDDLLQKNSFQAMIRSKELFQRLTEMPLKEGLKLASEINAKSRKTEDCKKGLDHFLNKKSLNWRDSI
jgi:methylglutaconyl-CoA hydratase